jgi:SAM-dependent methyltransferase
MQTIIKLIKEVRSIVMRTLFPKSKYSLLSTKGRNLAPLSNKYGFDRGKPIDRYFIEKFLDQNKMLIKGRCLEIHDDEYTMRFGQDRVTKKDILDIDTNNKLANIYGDLRNLNNIPDNIYDTLIITQTIGMIDDVLSAVKECHRILKPGGTMLLTAASFSPSLPGEGGGYWRFTINSFNYLLGKFFKPENVKVESFGSALAGQAFWVGMSQEEMSQDELDYNDLQYPIIIAAVVTK